MGGGAPHVVHPGAAPRGCIGARSPGRAAIGGLSTALAFIYPGCMSERELRFPATIGVEVKGETWSCVDIPGSAEFFGTKKTVRVDATIDDVRLENVGAMVTGSGGHMVSLSAKVRKQLGKDIGDAVDVVITPR
ncbi:uncharacterized protein DUF1905 [Microbacterium sp. AG238]|nr:uncharacterized protein DUF1905 [Microbacterium sp. AG238]